MRSQVMQPVHDRRKEIDPLSKLAVSIVAIILLLMATYFIIDYAARVDEARSSARVDLPANYRDTVKAMLVSTGHACPAVCDVVPSDAAFKVSCDTGQVAQSCALTRSYTLTLAPLAEPSR